MSYCRFSDNDFQCDVYCYEDVAGGFSIHVAGNRPALKDLPPEVSFEPGNFEAWYERRQLLMQAVDVAERVQIGLPHDGDSFNEPDARSAADRLTTLREIGYNVPQYAIDALISEASVL